jgi:reverse transcriptase-like protein
LTALYNLSLNWSVCPDTFKRANLCVVPKEGRRDKSNPRSYRLISLQSTLGKGLERVIAKRLAYEAVERTIIYVCATPKPSATDLILSLVDEVEDSLRNKKETVSLATFDVKGAFDAVSPNRMVRRLVDQGWPNKVCRWVQSFTNRREADLTLDGQTGDMSPLGGSLPQGSPISSILFMLFMAPLFLRGPHLHYTSDPSCLLFLLSFLLRTTSCFSFHALLSPVSRSIP